MCGRYVLEAPEDLSERFQLRQLAIQLPHTWNAAPTNRLPVIVENQEGEREAQLMQWGLIPRWAKPGGKKPMAPINARAETITEKPMFRNLVKRNRCLVPANGFYEWKNLGDHKQPYYITVPDDPLFGFAGLYDTYTNDEGEEASTYTIITTEPNELMSTPAQPHAGDPARAGRGRMARSRGDRPDAGRAPAGPLSDRGDGSVSGEPQGREYAE